MNVLKNLRHLDSPDAFDAAMREAGLSFPVADDLEVLSKPVVINGKTAANSIVVHPLEGFDAGEDGGPSDLTYRRYQRFARGGAGIIWYESITVSEDGKSSPRQMIINRDSIKSIKQLVERSGQAAADYHGSEFRQYKVLQLTHSGRKSVDQDWQPILYNISNNSIIDAGLDDPSGRIFFSDQMVEDLIGRFIDGAVLAAEAGFDAVDIKACHNNLLSDLLSGFKRPGRYGGSFENRTRALLEIIRGIKMRVGSAIDICVRLNAYDYTQQPRGWGMSETQGVYEPDLSEPVRLCRLLVQEGVSLFNISSMMPAKLPAEIQQQQNPGYDPQIEPYTRLLRLLQSTKKIKEQVPEGLFVATGLSLLDQFGANVAAGGIQAGWFDLAGFGRQALAYPDFAGDLLGTGRLTPAKCCIKCGKCFELVFKGHVTAGCVIYDQEVYLPMYRKYVLKPEEQR